MKKATSLQSSLSRDSESNTTAVLDEINTLPLLYGQVFKNHQSDTQARKPWFFCALKSMLCIDRGGIGSMQKRFTVKTYAPYFGGFEHPDCLQKQSIQKTQRSVIMNANTQDKSVQKNQQKKKMKEQRQLVREFGDHGNVVNEYIRVVLVSEV
ncbi:MAG: hypothetical protein R8M45_00305, partial [Ghiorsea sp.]